VITTTKGNVTIRTAVISDAAALRGLRIEALADRPEAFAADYVAAVADSPQVWADLVTKNASDNRGVICVASTEEGLVGMTGLGRGHWPKTRHSGVIWGVYVSPEWRGLKVAEGLLNECAAWAKAQGMLVLKLGVVTTNTPAIRFYARCGFTVYGIEPRAIYYNDVFYDELMMAKSI
jgi:ribosomal protein S18 acetylase RimI-like enzyme